MISLGISVHALVEYSVCCLTVRPECCMPKWMRLSGCCPMKTWDGGVTTVLGAINIPSGHDSSCRLISVIVGPLLHSCTFPWVFIYLMMPKPCLRLSPVEILTLCSLQWGCLPIKGIPGLLKVKSHTWIWGEREVPASTVKKYCAWLTSHICPSHTWTLQLPSHTAWLQAQLCLCPLPEGWRELQGLHVATGSITGGHYLIFLPGSACFCRALNFLTISASNMLLTKVWSASLHVQPMLSVTPAVIGPKTSRWC